jgi:hypothetical protein
MFARSSLPRCLSGMGAPWSKAGLVRTKFSGACRSGRAQTRVMQTIQFGVPEAATSAAGLERS